MFIHFYNLYIAHVTVIYKILEKVILRVSYCAYATNASPSTKVALKECFNIR